MIVLKDLKTVKPTPWNNANVVHINIYFVHSSFVNKIPFFNYGKQTEVCFELSGVSLC